MIQNEITNDWSSGSPLWKDLQMLSSLRGDSYAFYMNSIQIKDGVPLQPLSKTTRPEINMNLGTIKEWILYKDRLKTIPEDHYYGKLKEDEDLFVKLSYVLMDYAFNRGLIHRADSLKPATSERKSIRIFGPYDEHEYFQTKNATFQYVVADGTHMIGYGHVNTNYLSSVFWSRRSAKETISEQPIILPYDSRLEALSLILHNALEIKESETGFCQISLRDIPLSGLMGDSNNSYSQIVAKSFQLWASNYRWAYLPMTSNLTQLYFIAFALSFCTVGFSTDIFATQVHALSKRRNVVKEKILASFASMKQESPQVIMAQAGSSARVLANLDFIAPGILDCIPNSPYIDGFSGSVSRSIINLTEHATAIAKCIEDRPTITDLVIICDKYKDDWPEAPYCLPEGKQCYFYGYSRDIPIRSMIRDTIDAHKTLQSSTVEIKSPRSCIMVDYPFVTIDILHETLDNLKPHVGFCFKTIFMDWEKINGAYERLLSRGYNIEIRKMIDGSSPYFWTFAWPMSGQSLDSLIKNDLKREYFALCKAFRETHKHKIDLLCCGYGKRKLGMPFDKFQEIGIHLIRLDLWESDLMSVPLLNRTTVGNIT